jgi:precorrin-8X/cobalt-precorrin-8 methylmutase
VFERIVVVDWSANSTPKRGRDSIWIAVGDAAGLRAENPATRALAEQCLIDLIAGRTAPTLLGLDVSLGYPTGTADALGLDGNPWVDMAELIEGLIVDAPDNANNRFEVAAELNRRMTGAAAPFWGSPPRRCSSTLHATKPPPGALPEWRSVEDCLRRQGRRPFSSWQLVGAGAVGGQSLLAVPMVVRLRRRFPTRVAVWPFTTGLRAPRVGPGDVVVAEVWPSMVPVPRPVGVVSGQAADLPSSGADGPVRDEVQVLATVAWLAERNRTGGLADLFEPDLPPATREVVEREEGWILGVDP